jgi:hypothetical protein
MFVILVVIILLLSPYVVPHVKNVKPNTPSVPLVPEFGVRSYFVVVLCFKQKKLHKQEVLKILKMVLFGSYSLGLLKLLAVVSVSIAIDLKLAY